MTRRVSTLVAALMAVVSSPAWAECPTASDLGSGVRFSMGADVYWDLEGQGTERIAHFQWSPEFPVQTMELSRGVFIASLSTPSMAEPWRAVFDPATDASPPPGPGLDWSTRMRSTMPGVNRVDDMRYVFGPAQEMQFGACTYSVSPVQLQATPVSQDGDVVNSGYLYFPEFGAVVISHDGYGNSWTITEVLAL